MIGNVYYWGDYLLVEPDLAKQFKTENKYNAWAYPILGGFCIVHLNAAPAIEIIISYLPLSVRMTSYGGYFVVLKSHIRILAYTISLVITTACI